MVLTVHHLDKSRSHRIIWLLEEIGIPYEIKAYKRTAGFLAPEELRSVHPLGKSPVITDDDKVVAETGAIVEYIVGKYAPYLAPPASNEDLTLKYKYWLHFAEGSAMPPLLVSLILSGVQRNAPWYIRPAANAIVAGINRLYVTPNLERQTAFMEAEIGQNPKNWFVEDFSVADIVMCYPIELTRGRMGLEGYPNLQKLVAAVHERPAYKRAVEKAGHPVPKNW